MNWDEELRSIHTGTLFSFFGRVLVAAFFWYLIAMVPLIIIAIIIASA